MCAKDVHIPEAGPLDQTDTERSFAELVLRYISDGVVITDPERRIAWMNAALTVQTGFLMPDLAGRPVSVLLEHDDQDPAALQRFERACLQRQEGRVDILANMKSGQTCWVDLKVTPVFDSRGKHTHFILTMRDISGRKELEEQNEEMRHAESLRQSERQLLALTSEWLYSAKSMCELLMVVQRAMHTLIPEAEGALYFYDSDRRSLELATSWGTQPEFTQRMMPDECWAMRRGRAYSYGQKPIEFACDHVSRSDTPYFCLPIIAHGETIGLMHILFDGFEEGGVMRHLREETLRTRWDISLICAEQISLAVANIRLREALQERSVRDPLTGLWNRRWFMEEAPVALLQATRDNQPFALVSLDIDHFKQFNDQFGHDAGDAVLIAVAGVLQQYASDTVQPCRLGGEEFTLLCRGADLVEAGRQAESLRQSISGLDLSIGGRPLPAVTISAGIGMRERDGSDIPAILGAADRALYRAKALGRDRVVASLHEPDGAPECKANDEAA
ncbi:MAG: bifunctional diguanylate cyclase/phosphodiesterase [Roseinatronobacter sp.]